MNKIDYLTMGSDKMLLGSKYLSTLREANNLLGDPEALRKRMLEDGYLFIRGLQNPDRVKAARKVVLENLRLNGQINADYPLDLGVIASGKRGNFLGGAKNVTHNPEFLSLVN